MNIPVSSPTRAHVRADFEELVKAIRPELHRYCARMIGSVVDGEDIVQEALAKAYRALPTTTDVVNMRAWLFRIAHNKAIDYLRRSSHQHLEHLDDYPLIAQPDQPLEEHELVAIALSVFLQLAPKPRSCIILKDVMRYSLADISEMLDATVPEIKAALHRGRAQLRKLSKEINADVAIPLDTHDRERLRMYIDHFNARDFDAVRAMLADEVQLDLMNRTTLRGIAEVGQYFHRYEQVNDWHLAFGSVEAHPAILVYDPHEVSSPPRYFILLRWENAQVCQIRDYRYTPYVMHDAAIITR